MERQWDNDSRSSEFFCLRRAWRKNMLGLWDQICSYVHNHQNLASIFEDTSATPASLSHPPGDTLVDFSTHTNMDDVFMNYSTKPTSQLETVDETPMELEGFLAAPNPLQRNKETEDIGFLPNETEESKKKSKKKVAIPFPDDFRHYKYLPVFLSCVNNIQIIRIALRLNGLNQYIRQTNTLKLLKIIGEHELHRPSFSSVSVSFKHYQ